MQGLNILFHTQVVLYLPLEEHLIAIQPSATPDLSFEDLLVVVHTNAILDLSMENLGVVIHAQVVVLYLPVNHQANIPCIFSSNLLICFYILLTFCSGAGSLGDLNDPENRARKVGDDHVSVHESSDEGQVAEYVDDDDDDEDEEGNSDDDAHNLRFPEGTRLEGGMNASGFFIWHGEDGEDEDDYYEEMYEEEPFREVLGDGGDRPSARERKEDDAIPFTANESAGQIIGVEGIGEIRDGDTGLLGSVASVVDGTPIFTVEGAKAADEMIYDDGTIVGLNNKMVVGSIQDLTGTLLRPRYIIHSSSEEAIKQFGIDVGTEIFYFKKGVQMEFVKNLKGRDVGDASNKFDEEMSESEPDFSDEEKSEAYTERELKKNEKKAPKKGAEKKIKKEDSASTLSRLDYGSGSSPVGNHPTAQNPRHRGNLPPRRGRDSHRGRGRPDRRGGYSRGGFPATRGHQAQQWGPAAQTMPPAPAYAGNWAGGMADPNAGFGGRGGAVPLVHQASGPPTTTWPAQPANTNPYGGFYSAGYGRGQGWGTAGYYYPPGSQGGAGEGSGGRGGSSQ